MMRNVRRICACGMLALAMVAGCSDDGTGPIDLGPLGKLYVLNQADGTMMIFDTKTLMPLDTIDTRVKLPHYIEFTPDRSEYFVTTLEPLGGHIAKFDAATDAFLDSVAVPPATVPSAIAITADGQFGYVCNFSSPDAPTLIHKYNLSNLDLVSSIGAGAITHDLKITSDGKTVIATNRNSDNVTIVMTATDDVSLVDIDPDSTYPIGQRKYGPFGVIIDHRDSLAYVACIDAQQVRVLDIAAREIVDSINIPVATSATLAGPTLLAITPDDRLVFLTTQTGNSVVAFDTQTMTVLENFPLATPKSFGITISDDGSRVYAACVGNPTGHGRVYVFDTDKLVKVDSIDVGVESFGLIWAP